MIFVTTGTQVPFNRLLKAIDAIAGELDGEEIIVQAYGVNFKPKYFKVRTVMPPEEYHRIFDEARLIVSHAGIGSIVSALMIGKPILIMPRKASLNEHVDDHQMDTAHTLENLGFVPVAYDQKNLKIKMFEMLKKNYHPADPKIGKYASESLITSLRDYLLNS